MDWALVAAKILQGDATNVPVSQINNLLRSEKQRIKAVFCNYYKPNDTIGWKSPKIYDQNNIFDFDDVCLEFKLLILPRLFSIFIIDEFFFIQKNRGAQSRSPQARYSPKLFLRT